MAQFDPQVRPTVTPTAAVAGNTRHTRLLLVFYYLLAEVQGVRNIWFWQPSRLDILVPVALVVALGWLAVADAERRGQALPMFTQKWFVLLAPLLVPGYIIWSRRWRGVGWLVLHAVLGFALVMVFMHVGGILVFGEGWLRALDL